MPAPDLQFPPGPLTFSEKILDADGVIEFNAPTFRHLDALQLALPSILQKQDAAALDIKEIVTALFLLSASEQIIIELLVSRRTDIQSGRAIFPLLEKAVGLFIPTLPLRIIPYLSECIFRTVRNAMAPQII
jgi:hypothetical protein